MLHLVLVLLLLPQQTPTQVVRGEVVEKATQSPLPGANVIVLGTDPLIGTTTDDDGRFELRGVPLGRQDLRVSFLGFEVRVLPQVMVTAGKEVQLRLELVESVAMSEGVTVTPEAAGDRSLNELAVVSARTFSVEETRRYAGGLDDPARMAGAFPGIAGGTGVQDNALVIRGNAPKGVLWRLEGIEIPNPNHFAGLSVAGGGGLTLFSGQLLADSDFLTGAFPAEYGNALSGVFDMNFRTGNSTRREHAFQAGVLGLEAASEGPFRSGGRATYLVSYRYSTLGLLLPLLPTEDLATYQDLSFKISAPTRGLGRFEFWGIGGLDAQRGSANPDSSAWEYETWDRLESDLDLATGAAGISHRALLGRSAYLHTTAGATISRTRLDQDRMGDDLLLAPDLLIRNRDLRLVLASYVSSKLGSRHTNRTGFSAQRILFDQELRSGASLLTDGHGAEDLLQVYSQSQVRRGPASLSLGLHVSHFALNGETTLEPRIGARIELGSGRTLTAGLGLHSRAEDLRFYLLRDEAGRLPNRQLKLTKARHAVLGFGQPLGTHSHGRVEVYAQHLFDVPVVPGSAISLLNLEQDFTFGEALTSGGEGRNFGAEVILERFLHDGYYHLLTGSVFRSEYKGGDGVWRRSRFDRGYTLSALVGRELLVSGDDVLGLNIRLSASGGKRHSPVNTAASLDAQEVVFDETMAFSEQFSGQAVLDATVTWRLNGSSTSQVWALQVKNLLAAKDRYLDYNFAERRVVEVREGFPLPVLSWKVEF